MCRERSVHSGINIHDRSEWTGSESKPGFCHLWINVRKAIVTTGRCVIPENSVTKKLDSRPLELQCGQLGREPVNNHSHNPGSMESRLEGSLGELAIVLSDSLQRTSQYERVRRRRSHTDCLP